MSAPLPDQLAAALRALGTQMGGALPNELDVGHLRDIERWLGTARPLADYAPRTRRRYLKAAREGVRQPNKTEYQRRKARTAELYGGITPSQLTRLRAMARENEKMLRRNPQNSDLEFTDEFLQAATTSYGYDFMIEVMKEQRDSIKQRERQEDKGQGPHHVGNQRYQMRGERESRLSRMRQRGFATTDILYYYHGRTK